jgi:putative membrane protein
VPRKEPEGTTMTGSRWPRWVYGSGDEPDYRFSFANERTFLAWIRTALALIAGGVALDAIDLSLPAAAQRDLAVALVLIGLLCAVAAWLRWAAAERAMRRQSPLPGSPLSVLVALGVAAVAVVLAVMII